jgi:hypothetical protein
MARWKPEYHRRVLTHLLVICFSFMPVGVQLCRSLQGGVNFHREVVLNARVHYPGYRGLAETRRLVRRGNRYDLSSPPRESPVEADSFCHSPSDLRGRLALNPPSLLAATRLGVALEAQLVRLQV